MAHLDSKRAAGLEQLRDLWCEESGKASVSFYDNVQDALKGALSDRVDERIYVAGSLYLVGEIKEFLIHD